MDAFEIAKKRAVPGFMIFDHFEKPIYWSPAASEILQAAGSTGKKGGNKTAVPIPKEIFGLVDRLKAVKHPSPPHSESHTSHPTAFISEKDRIFHCRAFFLHGQEGKEPEKVPSKPHVMVLLEELTPRNMINKEKLKETYYFTDRHLDILTHLVNGSSNQQIGAALSISEDTVKAHLKNIMKRMGVNTRSSVLSKTLELS